MDTPPQSSTLSGPGISQPVLVKVICPTCRGIFTVEDLKVHMPSCQDLLAEQSQRDEQQKLQQELENEQQKKQ